MPTRKTKARKPHQTRTRKASSPSPKATGRKRRALEQAKGALKKVRANERVERARALDAAAWLSTVLDVAQDAIISIDAESRVVLFNPAAERMFGYTGQEISGQRVNVLMDEPYATDHDEYIERYERTRKPHAIGRIRM